MGVGSGAVGLLATTQLFFGAHKSGPANQRHPTEYLAPIVGGLALLGALGSSPSTDIGAHAFGLLAGFVLGIPLAFAVRRSRRISLAPQLALGLGAVLLIGGSWALALA